MDSKKRRRIQQRNKETKKERNAITLIINPICTINKVCIVDVNEDDSESNEAPNISESPTMQNKQIEEMSDDE